VKLGSNRGVLLPPSKSSGEISLTAAVRELAHRMEGANSSERMNEAARELRRGLAARGMLSALTFVPAAHHL